MSDDYRTSVHFSFWPIVILALLWNGLGVINYLGQMDPQVVAGMPASHQALILERPVWATVAFAIAVFAGTAGCLLLLFKRAIALPVFVISFVGVIVQLLPTLTKIGSAISHTIEIILVVLLPVVIAALLIVYSKYGKQRGWLR